MHRLILIGIGLILLMGSSSVTRLVDSSSIVSKPEIRSGLDGFCLDDHHDGNGLNAKVDIYTCNGTKSQYWTTNSDKIEHPDNRCLSVLNDGKQQGDGIVLNTCSNSDAQKWVIDLGGFENPVSGLCLSAPVDKNNTQLTLDTCNNLSEQSESWASDTWDDSNGSYPNCQTIVQKGQRVACYAEYQWQTWQEDPSLHKAMLNDYTDGNGYEEWCADFVSYIYREAGNPFENGERDGWDEYNANNIQYMGFTMHSASNYTPQPGDVAFFNYPGGHVEVVVKGGVDPTFIYGDSGTVDPATNDGDMNEDMLTSDGSTGQVTYYLSPN
jgi:hypothetical protein